jgi:hypothetical protein
LTWLNEQTPRCSGPEQRGGGAGGAGGGGRRHRCGCATFASRPAVVPERRGGGATGGVSFGAFARLHLVV